MTVGYLDTTKHALWPVITVEQLTDIAHRDDVAEVICNKCGSREPLDTQMLFPSETPPDMKVVDALFDHSCASCGAGVWDIAIRTSTAVVFCRTWVPEEVNWEPVNDFGSLIASYHPLGPANARYGIRAFLGTGLSVNRRKPHGLDE